MSLPEKQPIDSDKKEKLIILKKEIIDCLQKSKKFKLIKEYKKKLTEQFLLEEGEELLNKLKKLKEPKPEKVGYGVVGSSNLIILKNNPEKGYKLNVGGRYKGEYIGRIGDIEYLCSISDHLDKISTNVEKSTENQVIEGQIFYLAKLADINSEIYKISQRYVNFTSKFGYDKDEARKIKAECIKEIKEIYVAKIVKNYDVTRISEWNQYSRVAQRTTRNRYRG
jgi:hypothetical protein